MNITIKPALTAIAVIMGASAASAATVISGGTDVAGTTFQLTSGGNIIAAPHPAYANTSLANPAAEWVWSDVNNGGYNATVTFEVNFSLTAAQLSSASLSGQWGVDNYGSISLNGTQIDSISYPYPTGSTPPYKQLLSYGTTDSSLFVAGNNTVTYEMHNISGPSGFLANINVEAAEVPLPAALPLMLVGLGALGVARRRK